MRTELLKDKVVVVSGVGPGLGRSLALQCAVAGADVVLAARKEKRLLEVAKEVEEIGRRAVTVPTDIRDADACERLAETAKEAFGRVDGLINNAFATPPLTDLTTVDIDAVRAGFETNVLAALHLTRLFVPALEETGGSVVMVNSAVLRHSRRTFGAYKMAKAALLAMAQNLSTELGPRGIRVNTIAPGYIWARTSSGTSTTSRRNAASRRSRCTTRTPRPPTCGNCPSPTRSPTPSCSCCRRWPAPSPANAWTSIPASGTTRKGAPMANGRDSVGTVEDLHASARKVTGMDDFGGDEYMEGLRVLVESLVKDAGLTRSATRRSGRCCAALSPRASSPRRPGGVIPSTPVFPSSGPSSSPACLAPAPRPCIGS